MRYQVFLLAVLCAQNVSAQDIEIHIKSRSITAADLSLVAPQGAEILAQIAPNHREMVLTQSQQQVLLDNYYPGAGLKLRHNSTVRFVAGPAEVGQARDAKCLMTRHAVALGEFINIDDLVDTPCDKSAPRASIRINRSVSAPYAAADLPAFTYVGSLKVPTADPVKAGTTMQLRTISGSVTIERRVIALQSGFPGNRIFVQTDDGIVIARRLENGINDRGER